MPLAPRPSWCAPSLLRGEVSGTCEIGAKRAVRGRESAVTKRAAVVMVTVRCLGEKILTW